MVESKDDSAPSLVVDNGSGQVKAGFAGDDSPQAIFASIVGIPKGQPQMIGVDSQEVYIGQDAQDKRGILKLEYPIEHGIVVNWVNMTRIWGHTYYNELRIEPENHHILLTEAPLNPSLNRERMVDTHFNLYNVPACFVAVQAVLSLYAAGRITGIVLDSGDGVSHTVPIYEGYPLLHAIKRLNLAGRDITTNLGKLLQYRGFDFTTSAEKECVRDIKEQVCYVALNYEEEVAKHTQSSADFAKIFELPDGRDLTVTDERFKAPEALFDPTQMGVEGDGIHAQVHQSIRATEQDCRRELQKNIVLSGGTTMLPGIGDRLKTAVETISKSNLETRTIRPAERKYSVWIGGSILASLTSFSRCWITKDSYLEVGPAIIAQKCI